MPLHATLFYIVSALIISATAMAVTRRHMIHAVLFLVISFFGSALLFYLLGAPLLAALEVIIYAGAVMVLFLFIVMMMKIEPQSAFKIPAWQITAGGITGVSFLLLCAKLVNNAGGRARMPMAILTAEPGKFGYFLFHEHWLAVEIASLLLLVALLGVLFAVLNRYRSRNTTGGRISTKGQEEEVV